MVWNVDVDRNQKGAGYMMKVILLGLLFITTSECGNIPPVPPDPILTEVACKDVCATWDRLGCEESKPTKYGTTCLTWCENSDDIPAFKARFSCIVKSNSCEESRECK
jgi:hypothetical protein